MFSLFLKTIRKNIFGLAVYTLISAAFVWMYVAFYPSLAKESEILKKSFEALPKEFFQAFDIEIGTYFSSLEGFLSGEYFSIIWPIVLIILTIAYASTSIAGEVEKGTIELLLAQPISRLKIFLAKYFSGIVIIAAFVLLSNFSAVPFAALHNVDYQLQNYLTMSIIGFLFGFAIFGICTLLSSLSSTKGRPAAITGGVLIIMYALNIFSAFQESIDNLKFASFFHYYDFKEAIVNNSIDITNVSLFLAVGIITTVAATVVFIKRDISTT
ncbi:MAG: ABC transporter permease subunit [Candidatus Woykebacteria bacterium]